jgi:hypothetical protein
VPYTSKFILEENSAIDINLENTRKLQYIFDINLFVSEQLAMPITLGAGLQESVFISHFKLLLSSPQE